MNDLVWVSLQVAELERARVFWREAVGLKERSATPGWVELELRPDVLLALHPIFHPAGRERRGYSRGGPVLGIRVLDLDEMGLLLERHGAHPLAPAQPIPGGRSRDYEDPEGYVIELVQLEGPGSVPGATL
jgi:predicted enzyme related to lactoylglutathione lyase